MTTASGIEKPNLRLTGLAALCLSVLLAACTEKPDVRERTGQELGLNDNFAQRQILSNWENLSRTGARIPLQMYIRIGAASDPDVCTTGELYGPFTIEDGEVSGDATVTATPPTRRLANLGGIAVCTIITSPVNAELDLEADALFMDNEACTEEPADIAGVWEGNFSCSSSCGDESGFVSLTIVQDGYNATYSDSEASYEGDVCGSRFEYSGSGPGYTEGGAFVLNEDGTASKTSSYESTSGSCSGTCSAPVLIRR